MRLKDIFNHWHIKAICFVISLFLVFFTRSNSLSEKPMVVFLEARTNDTYTFTESIPSRVNIILKGEASEIQKVDIDDISTYIDASKIYRDGSHDLPVIVRYDNSFGKKPKVEIQVSPLIINVKLEEKITKHLRVESVITGIPSHGYEIKSHFSNPATIRVSGPKSFLEFMESIKTYPVDVTAKNSDFKQRVKLNGGDSRISFPEGEFVELDGQVTETSVSKVIENVNIAAKSLISNLQIRGELPQISVNVEGKLLLLEDFSKNNIALTVNLEHIIEPGRYEVPILHWTPKYAHIYNKSPDKITIDVIVKPLIIEEPLEE